MVVTLAFLLGVSSVLLVLLVVRARRLASPPEPAAVAPDRRDRGRWVAELDEIVTELGEEIAQLAFVPAAPKTSPESLADYRRALDSYRDARDALDARDPERVRQELTHARNALVRLGARAHGLPVPIDTSRAARGRGEPPAPQPSQDERFSYSGRIEQTYMIPIDWPEPGRAAIMEVINDGGGFTDINSVFIPADEVKPKKVAGYWLESGARARFYLAAALDGRPTPTHLRVTPSELRPGTGTWTVRLRPLSAAVELLREYQGTGSEVLVHRSNAPAVLGLHIDTSNSWMVNYQCLNKHRRRERCYFDKLRPLTDNIFGDNHLSAPFCGHGLIVIRAAGSARWSLSVTPERPGTRTEWPAW